MDDIVPFFKKIIKVKGMLYVSCHACYYYQSNHLSIVKLQSLICGVFSLIIIRACYKHMDLFHRV